MLLLIDLGAEVQLALAKDVSLQVVQRYSRLPPETSLVAAALGVRARASEVLSETLLEGSIRVDEPVIVRQTALTLNDVRIPARAIGLVVHAEWHNHR